MDFLTSNHRPIGRFLRTVIRRTPLRRMVMALRHTGLNENDVFIGSYPRSGNTWLRSMLNSCLFGEAMKEFRGAQNPILPYIGSHRGAQALLKGTGRLIKTHEAWRREYRRAVWILRDPRDVCVSEHRLALRARLFQGTLDEYARLFVERSAFGPVNWKDHAASWSEAANGQADLLCLRFETMKQQPGTELIRVLDFLAIPFTPDMIETAVRQNSVESLAARHREFDQTLGDAHRLSIPAVNQGTSGGWREALSGESVELIERSFGDFMRRMGYALSEPQRTL